MNQFNVFKQFLLLVLLGAFTAAQAQDTLHPLSYGYIRTDSSNYYKNYIDNRVVVISPASIAGDKMHTFAVSSAGWTLEKPLTSALINLPIVMGPTGDTNGCAVFTPGSMTGKIAFIWRGTCTFAQKVYDAQNAGAKAVVIANINPGALPIGMSATGTPGTLDTIPVFMVSNADGHAISAAYAAGAGAVYMTLSPWGLGNSTDLGILPGGYSQWHNTAIPYNQLSTPGTHLAYNGMDGAFVANYGTGNATNVMLTSTVTFTPSAGAVVPVHTGSSVKHSFPASDSIWAIYEPEYNISSFITGTGTVNTSYNVTFASTDDFIYDNTAAYSFVVTDSLYAKSRYDFANHHPIASAYYSPNVTTAGSYLWGPMYYVAKGGTSIESVTWSMASATDTGHPISSISSIQVYVFKMSGDLALDSFVSNGNFTLVGSGIKDFSASLARDTSMGFFTVSIGDSNGLAQTIMLDSNSWYFIAPELPASPSTSPGTFSLGCDGINNAYPRTYGRGNFGNIIEYPYTFYGNAYSSGAYPFSSYPTSGLSPVVFGYTSNIDSVHFSTQVGLVPSISMLANNHPPLGIKNVASATGSMNLYPNPATNQINVALALNNTAKIVTYTVLDASARVVSTQTHTNVLNETYTYSTNSLSSGNYFISINADGKSMFRKFTVLKN